MAVPVRYFDEALLRGFLARLDQIEAERVLTPVITLDRLREFLGDKQRVLIEQIIGLRTGDYGDHARDDSACDVGGHTSRTRQQRP